MSIPPQALDAETALLGSILKQSDKLAEVIGIVSERDFYITPHQIIFRACVELDNSGQAVDIVSVAEHIHAKDHKPAVSMAQLADMAKNTPNGANAITYALVVRDKSNRRRLIEAANDIIEAGYNDTESTTEQLIAMADSRIASVQDGYSSLEARPLAASMGMAFDTLEQRSQSDSSIVGLTTGFDLLDKTTAGFCPGDFVVLAGRPSMGKTAVAMHMAQHVGLDRVVKIEGQERTIPAKRVLIFSLEMPTMQLIDRTWSSVGTIELNKIRSGKLEAGEWARIKQASDRIINGQIHVIDLPALRISQMRSVAKKMYRNGGIDLILVDYLQLAKSDSKENQTQRITDISNGLKAMAKEFNCPVVALSQLNRSVEQRPNKRPMQSDLRDSGAIEQDADVIIFVYRDEYYYREKSAYQGIIELDVAKQRNGPTQCCPFRWVPKHQDFLNLDQSALNDFYNKRSDVGSKPSGGLS